MEAETPTRTCPTCGSADYPFRSRKKIPADPEKGSARTGEPLRIITGGLPPLPGASILDRRRWIRENLDHLRRALMWEPRGKARLRKAWTGS